MKEIFVLLSAVVVLVACSNTGGGVGGGTGGDGGGGGDAGGAGGGSDGPQGCPAGTLCGFAVYGPACSASSGCPGCGVAQTTCAACSSAVSCDASNRGLSGGLVDKAKSCATGGGCAPKWNFCGGSSGSECSAGKCCPAAQFGGGVRDCLCQ